MDIVVVSTCEKTHYSLVFAANVLHCGNLERTQFGDTLYLPDFLAIQGLFEFPFKYILSFGQVLEIEQF